MPKKRAKIKSSVGADDVCMFCHEAVTDELQYGKFMTRKGITFHYFCMLFSSGLVQRGNNPDKDGIFGFYPEDIKREIRRGDKLRCCYCKKMGATIGCSVRKCQKNFHLTCGRKNETLHQFFGSFCSYCVDHRPRQTNQSSDRLSFSGTAHATCPICLSSVEARASTSTLRAPCCKNTWFHYTCVQTLAVNAGYFFKCPMCNNKDNFHSEMLTYGIFIPEQDASWELETNAYRELLHRHDRCDHKTCKCPDGRGHSKENSRWEIILCNSCGSQGCHIACGKLSHYKPFWECSFCRQIQRGLKTNKNKKRTLDTTSSTISENVASSSGLSKHALKKQKLDQGSSFSQNVDWKNKSECNGSTSKELYEKNNCVSNPSSDDEIDIITVDDDDPTNEFDFLYSSTSISDTCINDISDAVSVTSSDNSSLDNEDDDFVLYLSSEESDYFFSPDSSPMHKSPENKKYMMAAAKATPPSSKKTSIKDEKSDASSTTYFQNKEESSWRSELFKFSLNFDSESDDSSSSNNLNNKESQLLFGSCKNENMKPTCKANGSKNIDDDIIEIGSYPSSNVEKNTKKESSTCTSKKGQKKMNLITKYFSRSNNECPRNSICHISNCSPLKTIEYNFLNNDDLNVMADVRLISEDVSNCLLSDRTSSFVINNSGKTGSNKYYSKQVSTKHR